MVLQNCSLKLLCLSRQARPYKDESLCLPADTAEAAHKNKNTKYTRQHQDSKTKIMNCTEDKKESYASRPNEMSAHSADRVHCAKNDAPMHATVISERIWEGRKIYHELLLMYCACERESLSLFSYVFSHTHAS